MSASELETDHYDVVVLGTGLAESIAAASLAKSGKTVLHLDSNDYYGGEQASLTLDELVKWSQSQKQDVPSSSSSSVSYSQASTSSITTDLQPNQRRYALSIFPAILPSRGELIDILINSDVSKYVSFRLLDSVSVYDQTEGKARRVPGSKEEVFKDKSVSLIDKRRLMKFLMFAAGEFENDDLLKGKETQPLLQFLKETFSVPSSLAESITYAIAHCSSPEDATLPALTRTRRYLRSIGRYGASAFLVGQYGGAGEVAQGFCRACAVFGGTYVLGSSAKPESIIEKDGKVEMKIPCHPRPITTNHLISASDHRLSSTSESHASSSKVTTAHAIAVLSSIPEVLRRSTSVELDHETETETENDDTAVIIFPPEEGRGLVRAYIMGEGTGSCPAGQYILYLSTETEASLSPREILQPYLSRLKYSDTPLFESYYLSHRTITSEKNVSYPNPETSPIVVLQPYAGGELLTEGLDWEAAQGRYAYEKIVGKDGKGFFEKEVSEEEEMGIEQDL